MKAADLLKRLNERLASGEHYESVLDDIYDTDDETYADFNCELFSGTYLIKENRIGANIDEWEFNLDNEIVGYKEKERENTMRKLKLEVYNNTTENIVERFEVTELKQAVKLATDQAYSEKEHYTIELLGEIDNGYDTLGTYELDEVDELQRELERVGD